LRRQDGLKRLQNLLGYSRSACMGLRNWWSGGFET
jgi:hypothetical protein